MILFPSFPIFYILFTIFIHLLQLFPTRTTRTTSTKVPSIHGPRLPAPRPSPAQPRCLSPAPRAPRAAGAAAAAAGAGWRKAKEAMAHAVKLENPEENPHVIFIYFFSEIWNGVLLCLLLCCVFVDVCFKIHKITQAFAWRSSWKRNGGRMINMAFGPLGDLPTFTKNRSRRIKMGWNEC